MKSLTFEEYVKEMQNEDIKGKEFSDLTDKELEFTFQCYLMTSSDNETYKKYITFIKSLIPFEPLNEIEAETNSI